MAEHSDDDHHHAPKVNPNSLYPEEAKGNANEFAHIPFQIYTLGGIPHTHKEADFSRTDLEGKGSDGKGHYSTPLDQRHKPKFALEFNRDGEKEIYSCNTMKAYPLFRMQELKYSLPGLAICAASLYNPFLYFHWLTTLQMYFAATFLFLPQFNYYNSVAYRVKAMYLLHGGEFVRLEFLTSTGKYKTCWVSIEDFSRLDYDGYEIKDERSVLNNEKLLQNETQVVLKKFDDFGSSMRDEVVWFSEKGNVTDPELFEQILKGKSIDTTNYYISLGRDKPLYYQDGYM